MVTTAANARGVAVVGLLLGQVQAAREAPDAARLTLGRAREAENTGQPDLVQRIDEVIRALGSYKDRVLADFDELLQVAADAAIGTPGARESVEQVLAQIEADGWRLTEPLRRIWDGERNADALTADIDANSALLIRDVLRRVAAATPG